MNLYLTWANNIDENNWHQYKVYFSSVSTVKKNDEFICLTDGIDQKYIDIISEFGCKVIHQPRKNKKIFTNRWFSFWKYLSTIDVDKVIITDARDVFFQSQPFSFCPHFSVGVCCEGFEHKNSPFNMTDQMKLQIHQYENIDTFTEWSVVNGGVCIAHKKQLVDFCFLMWSNCMGRSQCTDQAVLNFLYHSSKNSEKWHLFDPRKDSFCLTGEAYKENLLPYEVKIEDGVIKNHEKNSFCLFHQWDRTIFANDILKRFIK